MSRYTAEIWKKGVLLLLFVFLFSITAFAEDYTVKFAGWDEKAGEGRAVAEWERKDDSKDSVTRYRLRLYRGSTSSPVGDWVIVSGTKHEFTSLIAKKGSGSYFYVVYPTKGGEKMAVTSETLVVDSAMKRQMRDYIDGQLDALAEQEEQNWLNGTASDGTRLPAGWQKKNGSWYYREADGKLKVSCWLKDKGNWYYLSTGGEMLTGWQAINGKWYCFRENGALYVDTVTPDGSTVNENGEWVENGVVMTDERKRTKKTDTSTVTVLTAFDVSLSEKVDVEGELYKVSFKNTKEAKLVGQSYSVPQEQWRPGEMVTITVAYETYPGYAFSDTTAYGCSRAEVIGSQAGEDATVRTITLSYVPNLKLRTPDNFYMNSDNSLHWDAVPHVGYYEVKIIENSSTVAKKRTEDPLVGLDEYMYLGDLEVRVTAMPQEAEKAYIVKSRTAAQMNLSAPEVLETIRVGGKIRKYPDGSMTYTDASGSPVQDQWKQLAGNWYHFNASGYAENQGWYLDSTGYWYYFDDRHRMVTGSVTVDGKKYSLNDGSRKDIPLGARY